MPSEPQFWSVGEFVEHEFPTPLYLLEPLLPTGGIGLMFGKQNTGKTALAITLIKDVIEGGKFLGRYQTHGGGRAAYIGVDMPIQSVQERLQRMWEPKYKDNFSVVLHDNQINCLTVRKEAEWVRNLRAFKPDLVVIDTLHKTHFLDENSSSSVGPVFFAWKELLGPGTTILFIHHSRKDVYTPGEDLPKIEAFRGSLAWISDSDLAIQVTGTAPKATVSFPRWRFSGEQSPVLVGINTDTLLMENEPVKALERGKMFVGARPSATRAQLISALEHSGVPPSDAIVVADELRPITDERFKLVK